MASVNKTVIGEPVVTHGGTPGAPTSNLNLLRRSVLSCLLWENEFYESGEQIAARIATLAQKCDYEESQA